MLNSYNKMKAKFKHKVFSLDFFKRKEKYSKNIDPPKSTYLGQEFIEDEEQISVIISCRFHLSALIKHINFTYKDCRVHTYQKGCDFTLIIEKIISKKLFFTASKSRVAERFIVGYVNEILPILNEHLIQQKYLCGHFLVRTFSPLDIHELIISNKDNKDRYRLSFPFSVSNFPRMEEFAKGLDYKFIRDLIESTTFYYYYNLDDCIRKMISSIENFFVLRNITGRSFKVKLLRCLSKEYHLKAWESYLNMFYSNIMYVYKIRNRIVHDKFRMDFNDNWLCKKGIGTLFYIYQTNLNDNNTKRYNFSLMQQFVALDQECMGQNLDIFRNLANKEDLPIVISDANLDKYFFKAIEISKDEIEKMDIKLESFKD